jgi:hypothetical protein
MGADQMDTKDFDTPSKSLPEWGAFHKLSKATVYKMKRAGLLPELLIVPGFNVPRVTARADREWEERMKRLAQEKTAKLEQARRVEHARRAGQAAARSENHISKKRQRRSGAAQ